MELAKAEQHYTSCYCEENVWHLARSLQDRTLQSPDWSAAGAACHVVFVSNRRRMIPLWRQSAHGDEDEPCLWDYHVFCTLSTDTERWVYDLVRSGPLGRGDGAPRKASLPAAGRRCRTPPSRFPAAGTHTCARHCARTLSCGTSSSASTSQPLADSRRRSRPVAPQLPRRFRRGVRAPLLLRPEPHGEGVRVHGRAATLGPDQGRQYAPAPTCPPPPARVP